MDKLGLREVERGEWVFDFPEATNKCTKLLCKAFDELEYGDDGEAKRIFLKVLSIAPLTIDAYNGLAQIEFEQRNLKAALELYQKALSIANTVIPENFKGRIPWKYSTNRPFLRALKGIGLTYCKLNMIEEATDIFNLLLTLNPADHLDIQAILEDIEKGITSWDNEYEKILSEFETWLGEIGYTEEKQREYTQTIDFFLNVYLKSIPNVTYENLTPDILYNYFSDYLIRECVWTTKGTIKKDVLALQEFVIFMDERGNLEDVDSLLEVFSEENVRYYSQKLDSVRQIITTENS